MSANFFKINKGIFLDPQAGADPVGRDGDIYYNSTMAKFRKFQNGAWTDLDTGGGGGGGSAGWVAQEKIISLGEDNLPIAFPTPQQDLSYVVFAIMINDIDLTPQIQQVEVTNKSVGGFTAKWNAVTDSGNYRILYIVPMKVFTIGEAAFSNGSSSLTVTPPMVQMGANYSLYAQLQNLVDPFPQFNSAVITAKTANNFTANIDDITDSANYTLSYMIGPPMGEVAVGNAATSATITLPLNYGASSYVVIAMMRNTLDVVSQIQPMIITARTNTTFTASWSDPTDSANYVLVYYAISLSS